MKDVREAMQKRSRVGALRRALDFLTAEERKALAKIGDES
jgi:hypothetical protein